MTDIAVDHQRMRKMNRVPYTGGPVVYWMSRDQRVQDNWALLYAQHIALEHDVPLGVAFCLAPQFLGAQRRQYAFMCDGLEEVREALAELDIPFFLVSGEPTYEIPRFVTAHRVGMLVTDFDPLRIKRAWKAGVAGQMSIPFREVDAHNIVPCWVASSKQEYSAATIRRKLGVLVPEFLTAFPPLQRHPAPWREKRPGRAPSWHKLLAAQTFGNSEPPIEWLHPGTAAANRRLTTFIHSNLDHYHESSNDPTRDAQSDLSPYLHFGQLAAQRVALEVSATHSPGRAAFLEQLIVRRELSDNFCYYNPAYDTIEGIPAWAKRTLDDHRKDRREYVYDLSTFERAQTHDDLWNAAQLEMVKRGKMHNYMRMYWAKKILEWTPTPEDAFRIAQYLNDTYELDGRDPNGYVGIAWSLGGVHDRAWSERLIVGKVRYMNARGCARKFNVDAYIENATQA